jgi:hypothetical protein
MTTYNAWNLTGLTNISNGQNALVQLMTETSKQTNYMIGLGILISVYLVFFFALRLRGSQPIDANIATSFLCTIMAILMFAVGIISPIMLITFIILTPLSLLIAYFSR